MAAADQGLTSAQLASFERDGYLVLDSWLSPASMAAMRASIEEIIAGVDVASVPRSIFTTLEQSRTSDEYFLGSGDTVRCLFEAGAFDAAGNLVRPLNESINKARTGRAGQAGGVGSGLAVAPPRPSYSTACANPPPPHPPHPHRWATRSTSWSPPSAPYLLTRAWPLCAARWVFRRRASCSPCTS